MNRSQLFSNVTLQQNVTDYLKRHNMLSETSEEGKENDFLYPVCVQQCIKKLLMNYSLEMYDYFSHQFDNYIEQHQYHPLKKKKQRKIPFELDSNDENEEKFTRRPTAYSIFCNHMRENYPDYKRLKPQLFWKNMDEEGKEFYRQKSLQAEPILWTRKRRYKTSYGRNELINQPKIIYTDTSKSSHKTMEIDEEIINTILQSESNKRQRVEYKAAVKKPYFRDEVLNGWSSSGTSSTESDN